MKHTKTLKVRVRDKHAPLLRQMSPSVNFVWNYLNKLSQRSIRERGICECGVTHDRDVNAARNILALGHERPAGGIPAL